MLMEIIAPERNGHLPKYSSSRRRRSKIRPKHYLDVTESLGPVTHAIRTKPRVGCILEFGAQWLNTIYPVQVHRVSEVADALMAKDFVAHFHNLTWTSVVDKRYPHGFEELVLSRPTRTSSHDPSEIIF
jgi:hypothetical protein